jgi:hypothetical protein
LKSFIVTILILAFFFFQFSEGLVYLSFKINQDYIAKNLCIEKDVAGSTCKGCCQLKKKLNEQKEQKEQLPPQQTNKIDFNIFIHLLCKLRLPSNSSEIGFMENEDLYRFNLICSVFHPPRNQGSIQLI